MDPRTEQLLQDYRKSVEKLARGVYLQALAMKKELDNSAINPEDKHKLLLHCINLLITEQPQK